MENPEDDLEIIPTPSKSTKSRLKRKRVAERFVSNKVQMVSTSSSVGSSTSSKHG